MWARRGEALAGRAAVPARSSRAASRRPESVDRFTVESVDSSPTSSSVAPSRSSEKSPSYAGRADAEIVADRSFEHHGRLHDERDATPELTGIQRSGVAPIKSHRPRRRLDEAVETAKHSRLPRTRRADKRERAPTLYAERDIIQDVDCGMPASPRIAEKEMINLKNRIVHLNRRAIT